MGCSSSVKDPFDVWFYVLVIYVYVDFKIYFYH